MYGGLFNGAHRTVRCIDVRCFVGRFLVGLGVFFLAVGVHAAGVTQPDIISQPQAGFDSSVIDHSDRVWLRWLEKQIVQHPDIEAGRQRLEGAYSRAAEGLQPLYNPEVSTEWEREGSFSNYQFGLSQQLDWQGKRVQGGKLSRLQNAQAQQAFELLIQQQYSRVLGALIERQAVVQKAQLARNDELQLEALLQLVDERHQAGDLGELDAELALLSLTQRFSHTAQAMVALQMADATLRQWLPEWSEQRSQFPSRVLYSAFSAQSREASQLKPVEQWVELHPTVTVAKLQWQLAQQRAELMALNSRADPNVGIHVGSSGDEHLLGVTFSMPLKIRNKNDAALRASRQHALEAESLYRAAHTKQGIAIETSQAVLAIYRRHHQRWLSRVAGKGEPIRTTLLNRWNAGDLNTTEYLQALQRYSESQWAGIELKRQIDLAQLNWLVQTGQVVTHFNNSKALE